MRCRCRTWSPPFTEQNKRDERNNTTTNAPLERQQHHPMEYSILPPYAFSLACDFVVWVFCDRSATGTRCPRWSRASLAFSLSTALFLARTAESGTRAGCKFPDDVQPARLLGRLAKKARQNTPFCSIVAVGPRASERPPPPQASAAVDPPCFAGGGGGRQAGGTQARLTRLEPQGPWGGGTYVAPRSVKMYNVPVVVQYTMRCACKVNYRRAGG